MKKENITCPFCGSLASQIKGALNASYRQYDHILCKLMELEQQGCMELFAGDCPLEDTDAVLNAEQHYTVCHYLRCPQMRRSLFFGCLHPGYTGISAGGRHRKENLSTRLWGRCGTYFSQKKG